MKRSEAARYARWSALTALLLAVGHRRNLPASPMGSACGTKQAPPPLTENKERQSIGLTVSKNEGDHTVFTVQASKSTDLKGQDISLLEEVKVTVFGKLADRHDIIHTHTCRYAKSNGGIECSGEVQFDLESAADAARTQSDRRSQAEPDPCRNQRGHV